MTRANINYVYQKSGEAPRTLFFYWNGDQYPRGIKDYYNVLDFVNSEWSEKSFKAWAKKNYDKVEIQDLGEGGQPKIFYTDGFITDYTYVFDGDEISVWNWRELVFHGSKDQFTIWINSQE